MEDSEEETNTESFNHYEGTCHVCGSDICSSCGACHEDHSEYEEKD
jgi:hypothetical protein